MDKFAPSPNNEVYGHLEVLSTWREEKYGKRPIYCRARCLLCGNIREYRLNNLRTGHTKTCGCANRHTDLTGRRYGMLLVESRSDDGTYICRCDCGNKLEGIPANRLENRHHLSCGCLKSGEANAQTLIGRRFGKLTVVERTDKKTGKAFLYRCRCDCGGERMATSAELKKGAATSCGCAVMESVKLAQHALDKTRVDDTQLIKLSSATISKNNKSGVRGVCWVARKQKWRAYIQIKKTRINLGDFDTVKQAADVRRNAELTYFDPVLREYGIEPPDRTDTKYIDKTGGDAP